MEKLLSRDTGISKRQFSLKFGSNARFLEELLDEGVLSYVEGDCNPLRRKIDTKSLCNMKENVHYVICKACGSYQRAISTKHLTFCNSSIMAVEDYKTSYPDSPILCSWTKVKKKKTEEQKNHQSETLKARFKTPEGEITRKQISDAAKALMQTSYREQASDHLRKVNSDPEMRELKRIQTQKRWDSGYFREISAKWHEDNKDKSNAMIARARSFSSRTSKLHLDFKKAMEDFGIKGFFTEYQVKYYRIDEANPNLKLAIEIDGCYWHSCPTCNLKGPRANRALDKRKTSYLENRGWVVLRFWGHEVRCNPLDCCQRIAETISSITKGNLHD